MASTAIMIIILTGLILLLGAGLVMIVRRIGELAGTSAPPLPAPLAAAQAAIELLEVRPGDRVLDLGCGSGRFLQAVLAVQPRTQVIGLDHDPSVVLAARWRLRGRGAVLRRADLFIAPWPPADKVFCYLYPELLERLEPLLESHLSAGTRLVTADYALPHRRPAKIIKVDSGSRRGHTLYLYAF